MATQVNLSESFDLRIWISSQIFRWIEYTDKENVT